MSSAAERPKRVGDRLERVQQRLPALQEDAADQTLERVEVADILPRRPEPQAHDRGGDLRRRTKRAGRQRQEPLDVRQQRHLDRQASVVARPWRRREPVGDFLLEHQGRVRKEPAVRRPRAAA